MSDRKEKLISAGVVMPDPSSVYVSPDLNLEQLETGVTLYPGTRIEGADTWIGAGSDVGREGPATLKNCKLGRQVDFAGGFADRAIMLDGASSGLGAHFRAGSLLEEKASVAHTVGLKQTILMPYVALGSLINFCDILMAGGTSSKNHSEVGSSYIHFNFTPQQDKATASLIGDVPRGVCLQQAPIFLGGQGGLVGPCRIDYGNIIAAGCVCRNDILLQGQLHQSGVPAESFTADYDSSSYRNVDRKILNNLHFIGNLFALREWYAHIRLPFHKGDRLQTALMDACIKLLQEAIDERLHRVDQFVTKLDKQAELNSFTADFISKWPTTQQDISNQGGNPAEQEAISYLQTYLSSSKVDYLSAIAEADKKFQTTAQTWLEGCVNRILNISK